MSVICLFNKPETSVFFKRRALSPILANEKTRGYSGFSGFNDITRDSK